MSNIGRIHTQKAQIFCCPTTQHKHLPTRHEHVKPGRVGGLQNVLSIHNLALDAGIPAWMGGMLESGIGAGICVELATLSNFVYPNDLFPTSAFYKQDLTDPPLVLNEDCTFTASSVTGTPYQPIQERIDNATRRPRLRDKQLFISYLLNQRNK